MLVPIFKAGTFKDSKGVEHTYTVDDLDEMVTLYNEQPDDAKRKAPHVLGHPKDNAPAYGWVGKLVRKGETLLASCEEMQTEFIEAVKSGAYKFRSASFYGNNLLRHVGWLGAAQPAVPGLGEVQFTADDDAVEFDDFMEWDLYWNLTSIQRIFRQMRDFMIEEFGLDRANKVLDNYDIDNAAPRQAPESEFNQPTKQEETDMELKEQMESLSKDFAEAKATNEQLSKQAKAAEDRIAQLEKQNAQLREEHLRGQMVNYCDGLIAQGKMLPAEREYFVADLTEKAKASDVTNFNEGESPLEKTKAMLEGRTKHKLFDVVADKSNAPAAAPAADFNQPYGQDEAGAELDQKIRQYMAEKNITDYNQAMEAVAEQGGLQ